MGRFAAAGVVASTMGLIVALSATSNAKIIASTETACHNKLGRWVTVTMKDSGVPVNGWEGNTLHFQNDELQDLYSFTLSADKSSSSESFCLDHLGDEFSKCYTIYMDDQGYNPQQVSWTVKISTKNLGADWRTSDGVDQWVSGNSEKDHGFDADTNTMIAIKEGGSPADVKVLCGRLFKKLGRYSMKQIDKVGIDTMSNEDNMLYKSQNAMAKIESRAQDLKLYVRDSDAPMLVDRDDWAAGDDSGSTTTEAATTEAATTSSTVNLDCEDCPDSCTGCAVKSWRGDGQCDDDNNNCGCNWDGGDCCGADDSHTLYCADCECLDPAYS